MRLSRELLRTSTLVLSLTIGSALSGADQPMIGEQAPAFDLETLDGNRLHSRDLRGRYVVLHFGAGW